MHAASQKPPIQIARIAPGKNVSRRTATVKVLTSENLTSADENTALNGKKQPSPLRIAQNNASKDPMNYGKISLNLK